MKYFENQYCFPPELLSALFRSKISLVTMFFLFVQVLYFQTATKNADCRVIQKIHTQFSNKLYNLKTIHLIIRNIGDFLN